MVNAADARLDAEFKRVRGLKDMHALYSKVPSAPATPSETIEAKAEGSIPYHPTIPGDDTTLPPFEKDYEEMETALVLYRRDTSRPGSPVFPGAFPPAEQTQQLQIDGKLQDLYVTTQETKATSTEELDDMSTPSISLSPSTQISLPLDTVDGEDEEAPDTPQREVHLSPTEGPPRKPILVSSWPSAARFQYLGRTPVQNIIFSGAVISRAASVCTPRLRSLRKLSPNSDALLQTKFAPFVRIAKIIAVVPCGTIRKRRLCLSRPALESSKVRRWSLVRPVSLQGASQRG